MPEHVLFGVDEDRAHVSRVIFMERKARSTCERLWVGRPWAWMAAVSNWSG